MAFVLLPRSPVDMLRLSGCGGVSCHFSLSLLVRQFVSFETLLTCSLHCLELIVLSAPFSISLGMSLANCLHSETELSLDCPHRFAIIKVSFYSLGIH